MTLTDSEPRAEAVPNYVDLLDLSGRVFVVLGAGQGMGRQSAHALRQSGAHVVCVDVDDDLADRVADEVGGEAVSADIRSGAAMADVFSDISGHHEVVHGVVDVVGVAHSGPLLSVDEEGFDEQFDIVLRHAFHAIRYAVPHLRQVGGSMVFIGSMAGLRGIAKQAVYGAAKAALHHLVRTAAVELGPQGVRLNAIAPGFVRTPRLSGRLPEGVWDRIAGSVPNRRVASTADIAAAVLFLCSDMSRHVNGHVLPVDGGTSALAGMPPLSQLLEQ